MSNPSLCNYRDANIHLKETITVVGQGLSAAGIVAVRNNKQVIFKMMESL